MFNPIGHLKTITRHKKLVRRGCFEVGLYYQGMMHDLSKYNPIEFIPGCLYYAGTQSPNNVERQKNGVSRAWLHHKGRNKHHFEYWIDYTLKTGHPIEGNKMPVEYVVEMYIDRVAASKVYQKDKYTDASALEYFKNGKKRYMMHPDTQALLEMLLTYLADNGEEATNAYIRKEILRNDRKVKFVKSVKSKVSDFKVKKKDARKQKSIAKKQEKKAIRKQNRKQRVQYFKDSGKQKAIEVKQNLKNKTKKNK